MRASLFTPLLLLAAVFCLLGSAGAQTDPSCTFTGLRERYLSTRFLVQPIYYTTLGVPNYSWGYRAPNEFTPSNNFSVQWDGFITFPETGSYQFQVVHDDGFRMFLDNKLYCGNYIITPKRTTLCNAVSFTAGQRVAFQVDYFDNINEAVIEVMMKGPSSSDFQNLTLSMFQYTNCSVTSPNITMGADISPTTGSGSVNLSLSRRPLSNVTLSVSSDCYFFEECLFVVSPDTWNLPVSVAVHPNPDKPNGCCPIVVTGVDGDPDFVGTQASLSYCKKLPDPSFGNSFGDPHFLTLDGTKYDFFDIGDYYFVYQKNAELIIQARQTRCASASCNSAFAIRFKSATFYMYLAQGSNTPTVSVLGDFEAEGAYLIEINNGYRILTHTGIDIRATVGLWAGRDIYYLNLGLRMPQTFQGQIMGLAGMFDGRADNDWTTPDGTLKSDAFNFAKAWVVPEGQNLFVNASASIPAKPNSFPSVLVRDCSVVPTKPNGTTTLPPPKEPSSPLGNDPVPQPNGTQTDCTVFDTPEEEADARESCEPFFNDAPALCCKALGVDPQPFLDTCLCDYNLADGPDFTAGNVQAFYEACSVREEAAGVTCDSCPQACSGNGDCVNGQCNCDAGFTGDSCSVPTSPPVIGGILPIAIPSGCPSLAGTITVSGSGFYGSLSCKVGSETTAAVRISNFQLLCALPLSLPSGLATAPLTVTRDGLASNTVQVSLFASCCSAPCLNDGVCIGLPDSPVFTCDCPAGFVPPLCTFNPTCPATVENGGSMPQTSVGGEGSFTCPAGTVPEIKAPCTADGFGDMEVSCVVPSSACPAATQNNVMWPKAFGGSSTFGICAAGFSGEASRFCHPNGTWAAEVQGSCTRNTCPASISGTSSFSATPSLTTATGTCLLATTGTPTRTCNADGTWGPVQNPCVAAISCSATFLNNANYPATSGGSVSEGQCVPGYQGTPTRTCNIDGSWGAELSSCQRAVCPAETVDGISFPATLSLTKASGTCSVGTGGTPTRTCNADGTWGPIVSSCFTCPAEDYGRASWPATPTGELAVGQCTPGWTGVPRRECFANGTWASYLSVLCTRLYCQPVTDGIHAFKIMEAGTQAYGSCVQGTGRPWRQCYLNGTFGPIMKPCTV